MSSDTIKTLAQAFILCCLEYFNSMFCGIIDGLMSPLQSVQNVAAHFGVGHLTLCPHNFDVRLAALACGSVSDGF